MHKRSYSIPVQLDSYQDDFLARRLRLGSNYSTLSESRYLTLKIAFLIYYQYFPFMINTKKKTPIANLEKMLERQSYLCKYTQTHCAKTRRRTKIKSSRGRNDSIAITNDVKNILADFLSMNISFKNNIILVKQVFN